MEKLWCEIEDELLSLKNALQRGGESDCLYCLCNKKKFPHFFLCIGIIHVSSNSPLNCKSNRNPEAARHIPSNNKASINNPSPLHELAEYYIDYLFQPVPNSPQPRAMHPDSNPSFGMILQLPGQELCLCSCVCLCVHMCV